MAVWVPPRRRTGVLPAPGPPAGGSDREARRNEWQTPKPRSDEQGGRACWRGGGRVAQVWGLSRRALSAFKPRLPLPPHRKGILSMGCDPRSWEGQCADCTGK